MTNLQSRLLKLISERSFKKGKFMLASGDESTYYIDGKMSEVFSESAALIGEVFYERLSGIEFDAIGGLEVGAVPLTTATVISYHNHNRVMEGFWVREREKQHGTKKVIEGNLKRGSRVIILDDVATRGQSALKAVNAVKDFGCEVLKVIALVDRLQGAEELFANEGIEYDTIFTVRDLGVSPDATVRNRPETVAC